MSEKDEWKGFGIVWKRVLKSDNLSVYAKALYALLKTYKGNKSKSWPGYNLIQEDLGIARATVKKAITDLVSAGYLTVVRGRTNNYIIHDGCSQDELPKSSQGDTTSSSDEIESSPREPQKFTRRTSKVHDVNSKNNIEESHEEKHEDSSRRKTKKSGNKSGMKSRIAPDKKTKSHVLGCIFRDHDTVKYFYDNFSISRVDLPEYLNEFISDSTNLKLDSFN